MLKKVIIIFLFLVLINCNNISFTSAKNICKNYESTTLQESHVILEVPYIPQNEGYFCYYACIVMILNYISLNTTLDEFLFYDGLGYTHSYDPDERLPIEGCYDDLGYVFDLYGVEEDWWYPNHDLTENERWEAYFSRLKEKISNDTPIITRVDPFSMPSLRNQYKIPDFLWNKLFLPSHHLIVVVGYNVTNQSICYNDPNAGFYGDNSFGDHAWMNLNDFRQAISNIISGWNKYLISDFNQINEPYSKEERFENAFIKNIEKINSTYDWYYSSGINASKEMKNDFSKGKQNRTKTINLYKQFADDGFNFSITNIMHKLCSFFFTNKSNIFDIFMVGIENPFYDIYTEKKHVAEYLEKSNIYPDICRNQSILLKQETQLWEQLSNFYKIFLKRGSKITDIRANIILYIMEKTMDETIQIEQQIIDEGTRFLSS